MAARLKSTPHRRLVLSTGQSRPTHTTNPLDLILSPLRTTSLSGEPQWTLRLRLVVDELLSDNRLSVPLSHRGSLLERVRGIGNPSEVIRPPQVMPQPRMRSTQRTVKLIVAQSVHQRWMRGGDPRLNVQRGPSRPAGQPAPESVSPSEGWHGVLVFGRRSKETLSLPR